MGRARQHSVTASSRRRVDTASRSYLLQGVEGPYRSTTPGLFGGHRRQHIYGRLDCASALRAIANGGPYPQHRVFFADADVAVTCGYRPCARCLPAAYATWKARNLPSA